MKNFKYLLSVILLMPFALIAQESSDTDVEEVVVVGSQIKGAKITGVLPVTIISAEDVDNLGIDSGDELLENMVEQGNNYFNEAEETSGGVNAGRGKAYLRESFRLELQGGGFPWDSRLGPRAQGGGCLN